MISSTINLQPDPVLSSIKKGGHLKKLKKVPLNEIHFVAPFCSPCELVDYPKPNKNSADIFIGPKSANHPDNHQFLLLNKIQCVISLSTTPVEDDHQLKNKIKYHYFAAIDNPDFNITQFFDPIHSIINDNINNNKSVLIHCNMGVSRSGAILISYLIKTLNLPFMDAYKLAKRSRNAISPNHGFIKQLKEYQIKCNINDNDNDQKDNTDNTVAVFNFDEFNKFSLLSKVTQMLNKGIDNDFINWNIFELNEICQHQTLLICSNYLFTTLDLYSKLNINQNKLLSFLFKIESGYLNIPYHNYIHATDVMLNTFYYLIKSGLIQSDLDAMICLISAVCHDYKHPGLNEKYLIDNNHAISVKYSGQSILEQMHINETFQLLSDNKYNFLDNFSVNDGEYVKEYMNDMILGTDPSLHNDHIKTLTNLINKKNNDNNGNVNIISDNRKDIMIIGLHCGDLGSVCKAWNIFESWGILIFKEWFNQGDKEKELNNFKSVSAMLDRNQIDKIPERHSKFLQVVMLPFYEKWSSLFPDKPQFSVWCKQMIKNNTKLLKDGVKYK